MAETLKAQARRDREGFFRKYTAGRGIDIGCNDDPVTANCDLWDRVLGHGDATLMEGVPDAAYDWVHASHVLEHIPDPATALRNWWRILKPGGYLIVMVPHRDLYEKRLTLPSRWNGDHKHFWLPWRSEPPCTRGLIDCVADAQLAPPAELITVRTLDDGYARNGDNHASGEYSIEIILRKPTTERPLTIP